MVEVQTITPGKDAHGPTQEQAKHAKRIGPTFLPHYDELLRQTAWRDAEPLARDFLGVELEDPETWMAAIAPLETDLEAFLEQVG